MCGILCIIQCGGKPVDLKAASECLSMLKPRGPDKSSHERIPVNSDKEIYMGFSRLAIMDKSDAGLQPFVDDIGNFVVCNGEIYNYKEIASRYSIEMETNCDCEVILPTFQKVGMTTMVQDELDAEFATVIYDHKKKMVYAARDRFGVRPLFYGYNKTTNTIGFASELKALHGIMEFVEQLEPNKIMYVDLETVSENPYDIIRTKKYYLYESMVANLRLDDVPYIQEQIRSHLTEAVRKRLHADRPIGFLLSGGLDSSLIVSIATKILGPENIVCFSVGLEGSPDVEAAKKVVKFLGIKQHHIVPFSIEQGISELPNVIRTIESYDITTTRASTPQYILAKYVNEKTDVKVLLSGEGSDEISGSYKYFRDAPNMSEFHWDSIRLIRELCYFDNLRTDRTMAGNGLEVRCPFLDFDYVEFITRINPSLLMYRPDYIEKRIVRESFVAYLPDEILYRPKEAFSDAVSNRETNWYKSVQTVAESQITDEELANNPFEINKPEIKEALFYRRIFNEVYPGRDNVIPHYWLPKFQKEKITDPSATVLKCD